MRVSFTEGLFCWDWFWSRWDGVEWFLILARKITCLPFISSNNLHELTSVVENQFEYLQ